MKRFFSRQILIFLIFLFLLGALVYVSSMGDERSRLSFTSPPDPNMIPAFILLEKGKLYRKGIELKYIPSRGAGDMMAHLQRGDVDLALFSLPGGARLYSKGFKEIRLMGVHVWKALYVVAGRDVNGWGELKGKHILIAFRGGPQIS